MDSGKIILQLLCATLLVIQQAQTIITHPPVIVKQYPVQLNGSNYDYRIFYATRETIELPCVASAEPAPTYRWELNERDFDVIAQDGRANIRAPNGTLVLYDAGSWCEGFYKCFAENPFGTAVANTIQLEKAYLGAFQKTLHAPLRRQAGQVLRIPCLQPASSPEALLHWTVTNTTGTSNISYNDRIMQDPDGWLNFAYLLPEDTGSYKCNAFNTVLRRLVQSQPFSIEVTGGIGNVQSPPEYIWSAISTEVFIRGRPASIKCLFSGRPTPNITWSREDGRPISGRAQDRNFNTELYFNSIEYEDAGNYECSAINAATPTAINFTTTVSVLGYMRWIDKPASITKLVNESVTFVCRGEGRPSPARPRWFKNAKLISGSTGNMIIGNEYGPGTTLTVSNLDEAKDTMALQCNITNNIPGSWIHTSFYLNVKSNTTTPSPQSCLPKALSFTIPANASTVEVELSPGKFISLPEGEFMYKVPGEKCKTAIKIKKVFTCPKNTAIFSEGRNNLGIMQYTDGHVTHMLSIPVGTYSVKTYSEDSYCMRSLQVLDSRVRKRLDFQALYNVKCSYFKETKARALLENVVRQRYREIWKLCSGVCEVNTAAKVSITCKHRLLKVTWPTKTLLPNIVIDVPKNISDAAASNLKSFYGMSFEIISVGSVSPLIPPFPAAPDYLPIKPILSTTCEGGLRYEKETASCR